MAVAKNTLRVLTLERVGEFFNQQTLRLRYTPRKFVIHPGETLRRHPWLCVATVPEQLPRMHWPPGSVPC